MTRTRKGRKWAEELLTYCQTYGRSAEDALSDPVRLAREVTFMRAAHDRRAAEVLSVMDHANPEAGGIDVIAQLLTMIYVRGF